MTIGKNNDNDISMPRRGYMSVKAVDSNESYNKMKKQLQDIKAPISAELEEFEKHFRDSVRSRVALRMRRTGCQD